MLKIYCSPVQKQLKELVAAGGSIHLLSFQRRSEIERLRRTADRSRALAGEFLCRRVIAVHMGVSPGQVPIQRSPLQKPFLAVPGLFFNLAHSGDRVVLAVSSQEVGVDVEKIRPVQALESVVSNFFSQSEQQELLGLQGRAREECFFDIWTLKESFLKAIGKGLAKELPSFSVKLGEQGLAHIEPEFEGNWRLRVYRSDPGYRLSVCSELPELPEEVEWV